MKRTFTAENAETAKWSKIFSLVHWFILGLTWGDGRLTIDD